MVIRVVKDAIEAREINVGYCLDAIQPDSSLKRGKVGNKIQTVMSIATRVGLLKPWDSAVIAALEVSNTAGGTECMRGMR